MRAGAEVGPREGPVDFAVEVAGFDGAVRTGADVGPREGPVDFVAGAVGLLGIDFGGPDIPLVGTETPPLYV